MAREHVDLLVRDGLVVTVDPQHRAIRDGFVAVRDGGIVAIGGPDEADAYGADDVIEARGCAVMPGLVNAHTHAAMTLLRGVADDLPLEEWLNQHIWPIEAEFVSPEFVYAGTALAAIEMLSGGVTCFADMYFFQDEVARAATDIGIRAVLGEALLDFPSPNAKTPQEGLAIQREVNERYKESPWAWGIVMAHAPYSCSAGVIQDAKALADEQGLVFYIHLAETEEEVRQIADKSGGLTPVGYLDSLGVLDRHTTGAHGVQLTGRDIGILAERGAKIVHCPESNMKLASGMAPVVELLEAGVTVGLGTDGAASNNDLSMFSEMDTAAKLQKVRLMDPAALPARQVVTMATIGSARCLGLDHLIGSLEVGKRADMAIVNLMRPHLVPLYDVYSTLVYACDPHDVRDTIVEGKVVMRDREITSVDTTGVVQTAVDIAERVREFDRDRG